VGHADFYSIDSGGVGVNTRVRLIGVACIQSDLL